MVKLIDVTFRDGGHQLNFDWPSEYVAQHVETLKQQGDSIEFLELGYWKQVGKFSGAFYGMDESTLEVLPEWEPGDPVRAVMADFHYCSHDAESFPEAQKGLGLLRMTSRKEHVEDALKLLREIKESTGLETSLNLFNITNYLPNELERVVRSIPTGMVDFVYFADTHGALRLAQEAERFETYARMIREKGITPGFHLHDHGGMAMANYQILERLGYEYSDASLNGLGKGLGNLKLEFVVEGDLQTKLLELYNRNRGLLEMPRTPFGLVAAVASVTDHYALQAEELSLTISEFTEFCTRLSGFDRDNYNPVLMQGLRN